MAHSVPQSSTTGDKAAGTSVHDTAAHGGFTRKVISTAETINISAKEAPLVTPQIPLNQQSS